MAQPVLGVVSSFRSSSAKDLRTRVAGLAREPTVADPLRHLAGKLAIANGGSMPRSLLIVGARMGDGAGALATNLAMALSEGGRKVTLVDANGHEREASEMLQTSASLGTVDALMASTGRATDRIVQRQPGLSLLPYGSVEPVVELTDTAAPKRMVSQLAGKADLVVVNGPPMDRSASAVAWSRVTDATLFVVHANYVSRRQVLTALDDLDRAHANSVAIVISQRRPGRSRRGKRPPQEAVEKTAEPPVQPVSVGAGSPHTDGNASTGRRGRRRVGRNSEGH